eukprot:scaffold1859_cov103-Isochrysis_galbana.AAC.1
MARPAASSAVLQADPAPASACAPSQVELSPPGWPSGCFVRSATPRQSIRWCRPSLAIYSSARSSRRRSRQRVRAPGAAMWLLAPVGAHTNPSWGRGMASLPAAIDDSTSARVLCASPGREG